MSTKNSVSVLALMLAAASLAAPAYAQNAEGVEAVTVTGSRIAIEGYQQPTPVTVINAQQMQRDSYVNIDQSLVQLPSVGVSATPSNGVGAANLSQADAGLSTVNLRNLGVDRTLVLFDGQRVARPTCWRRRRSQSAAIAACQPRRCGDGRRLGGLWLRRGGRRGQPGPE